MIRKLVFLLVVLSHHPVLAQEAMKAKKAQTPAGEFQLGMRQTFSFFGDEGEMGLGTGGQFRLMLGNRINTEWFADYMQTDLSNLGKRTDAHIGWSVMFYLMNPETGRGTGPSRKILPYLLAGHCFDYTKVTVYNTLVDDHSALNAQRWSSAAQTGLGTHFFLGQKFNLSTSLQYMLHLGNDIHTHVHEENGHRHLEVEHTSTNNQLTFEGHLLFTVSLNIKIADLW